MDEQIAPDDLRAMAARASVATTGPWQAFIEGRDHLGGDDFIRTGGLDDNSPDMYVSMSTAEGSRPAGAADLDFIANARQDIPRLIAALLPATDSAAHPPDEQAEADAGRTALWLDGADLRWLAQHCACPADADAETTERCARVRFRANAALHKSGNKPQGP